MADYLSRIIVDRKPHKTLRAQSYQVLVVRKELLEHVRVMAYLSTDPRLARRQREIIFDVVGERFSCPERQRTQPGLLFIRALCHERIANPQNRGKMPNECRKEITSGHCGGSLYDRA